MERAHTSSNILTLASQAGIPITPGEDDSIQDEAFTRFCTEFQALPKSLTHHVVAT